MFKPLPVGIEFFEEFSKKDYYYVDKTLFIKELIDNMGKVNLFTRPRRFGKTLTLDMLRCFFEAGQNSELFKGLKIMDAGEKYTSMMGQYPVIFLTLKSAKNTDFYGAFMGIRDQIIEAYEEHEYVVDSPDVREENREEFQSFIKARSIYEKSLEKCRSQKDKGDLFRKEVEHFKRSISFLCSCLKQYYGKNTIILLDEYDVPLESAFYGGFYEEMVSFIRSLFEQSLKTNKNLEFAVITGCLRISRESIFTGMNNLSINSIRTPDFGEYFGFTDGEVQEILAFYDLKDKYEEMKEWYNGYNFGGKNVYNPWSSIMYLRDHTGDNRDFFPMSYWANTSSNSIVKDLVERADNVTKEEIERLIEGGSIEKPVHEDITYGEIYEKQDNLWNFMYYTGYLKNVSERHEGQITYATLRIPNAEVGYIYSEKVINWFDEKIVKASDRSALFRSMLSGDAGGFERELNKLLRPSISYYDNYENFYHGFMAGLFVGAQDFAVRSNREAGDGRSDLLVLPVDIFDRAFVIELKTVKLEKGKTVTKEIMDEEADKALKQIEDMHYMDALMDEGYSTVGRYGISFFKKTCRVHYLEGYPAGN